MENVKFNCSEESWIGDIFCVECIGFNVEQSGLKFICGDCGVTVSEYRDEKVKENVATVDIVDGVLRCLSCNHDYTDEPEGFEEALWKGICSHCGGVKNVI